MDCCDVYAEEFDGETALSSAQRYRRKGLTGSARVLADALASIGVEGFTVVDFGGGVGALGMELLKLGAKNAVDVELSASYRDAATALALEAGVDDRFTFRVADAAGVAGVIDRADIVVLNRVVCCYPEGETLMDAAMSAGRRYLGLSYPTVHWGSRAVIATENALRRRRGSAFRTYVHPRAVVEKPLREGFKPIFSRTRPIWSVRIYAASEA